MIPHLTKSGQTMRRSPKLPGGLDPLRSPWQDQLQGHGPFFCEDANVRMMTAAAFSQEYFVKSRLVDVIVSLQESQQNHYQGLLLWLENALRQNAQVAANTRLGAPPGLEPVRLTRRGTKPSVTFAHDVPASEEAAPEGHCGGKELHVVSSISEAVEGSLDAEMAKGVDVAWMHPSPLPSTKQQKLPVKKAKAAEPKAQKSASPGQTFGSGAMGIVCPQSDIYQCPNLDDKKSAVTPTVTLTERDLEWLQHQRQCRPQMLALLREAEMPPVAQAGIPLLYQALWLAKNHYLEVLACLDPKFHAFLQEGKVNGFALGATGKPFPDYLQMEFFRFSKMCRYRTLLNMYKKLEEDRAACEQPPTTPEMSLLEYLHPKAVQLSLRRELKCMLEHKFQYIMEPEHMQQWQIPFPRPEDHRRELLKQMLSLAWEVFRSLRGQVQAEENQ